MGSHFPKINLRPDLPPGSEVGPPSKARRARLVLLGVGLLLLVAILAHFKGGQKKEKPRITVKVGTTQSKEREKPLFFPPSTPGGKEKNIPQSTTPTPGESPALPPRTQGKTLQNVSPANTQNPSFRPLQEKHFSSGKGERLKVVLFPGLYPGKVKEFLAQKGIPFHEGTREETTTLWRVLVETTPETEKGDITKLKRLVGTAPWRLKHEGKIYLAVASFKEKVLTRRLTERLKTQGFKTTLVPVNKKVNLKVISFSLSKDQWEGLKPSLDKLGAQVLKPSPLESKASLPPPASTTSQGKGSSAPLSR